MESGQMDKFFKTYVFHPSTFTKNEPRSKRKKCRYNNSMAAMAMKKDPCAYCGDKGGSIDHIIPKIKGGTALDNLTGSCQNCNSRKSAKDLLTYMLEIR